MAKKQNPSSNDQKQEMVETLDGFRDVLDLMSEDQRKRIENIANDQGRKRNGYELYSFLESELQRLSKLDILFTQKIPTKEEFSQTSTLLEKQGQEVDQLKEDIIKKLVFSDSPLQVQLERLFNESLG